MEFIELLKKMKQECAKRARGANERGQYVYYICDGCKFKNECRLVDMIAEEIIDSTSEDRDIERIEKLMKELGL